jgi:purine nucleosidase
LPRPLKESGRRQKIILDCDPGQDDTVAIILAHGSPRIDLCAITTVAGNQTLDKTTLNARRVATVAGIRGVPIAAGCDRPLLRELVTAGEIHGASGLDGPTFPEPQVPLEGTHAVDLIVDLVMASPGEVALVPTGPLTNVAMALRREPRIAKRVKEVVLMGGSYTRGNVTPAAEFNIMVDPEAAAIVFEAGWPLTMIGLDLTHQARATPEVIERIAGVGTPLSTIVLQMLEFYGRAYRAAERLGHPPVHDPCAIARIIRSEVVRCVDAFVAVETQGRWTSGMTVTEFRADRGRPFNARVATELDFEGFWDLVVDALARIGTPPARNAAPG